MVRTTNSDAEKWQDRAEAAQQALDSARAELKLRLEQIDGWKERLRQATSENKRLRAALSQRQETR
jgi:cell shape-determining protein MreC